MKGYIYIYIYVCMYICTIHIIFNSYWVGTVSNLTGEVSAKRPG